ncbi:hypothetical protein [Chamaesiphon sp.]|uniref:hypothetical protein n=1 Tax=Chamaesiphon sp. TaxID=2814140 RepID=UPI00359331E7
MSSEELAQSNGHNHHLSLSGDRILFAAVDLLNKIDCCILWIFWRTHGRDLRI